MKLKRLGAIIVLGIFLLLILALITITVINPAQGQNFIMAIIFLLLFLSVIVYAFILITRHLKERKNKTQ